MKKISKIFLGTVLAVALLSVITGCDKKKKTEEPVTDVQATTLTVDASDYGKWVYISFVQKKEVEISDSLSIHFPFSSAATPSESSFTYIVA